MVLKLATLNLCLGLPNKKLIVKELIIQEKIDVLCMQETEIPYNLDHQLLSFPGFCLESETNSLMSRVGIYVNSKIKYVRRNELEGKDSHIVIIDVIGHEKLRIINIYRTFCPKNGMTPKEFFVYQLGIIKNAMNSCSILLGDFNLDIRKKGLASYPFKSYFDEMDLALLELNLIQIVDFSTWSRTVSGQQRESIIDHVYTTDPLVIENLRAINPGIGDHTMITLCTNNNQTQQTFNIKRNWTNYSKESLCTLLSETNWRIDDTSVQGYWNAFENKLIAIVDKVAPLATFVNNSCVRQDPPQGIKQKINLRKRLLRKFKLDKSEELKHRIKELDNYIKQFHHNNKAKRVRKAIIPGNTKSLWNAVKIARDVNVSNLPNILYKNGVEIPAGNVADSFAGFFDKKIRDIVDEVSIDINVYNGKRKINECGSKNFMDPDSVKECILSLKIKNAEGFDRIPQRILVDGVDFLHVPISSLMNKVYNQRSIPEQWLVAKTVPIFKNKGSINEISNYRPIANLCTTSKIFEKLILKRISEIQDENCVDLSGTNQHGFKKQRSTSTLSIELQSIIARALDEGKYGLVSSLDLSSAFDVVNVNLLLKRLRIIGLPSDIVDLIKVWLSNRSFYVNVDGENSFMYDLLLGTVQGSILGPLLYAIFVAPLSDIEPLLTFADDNYIPRFGSSIEIVVSDMEKSLEIITKWLKDSGLSVNKNKTEICLFYKHDHRSVKVKIGSTDVTTKTEMNVLGIKFDSKLSWSHQVSEAVTRANRALNAIKLISRYFNSKELLQILTSNFFSILYYNSEVWMMNNLKIIDKKLLLTTSSNAIKLALHYPDPSISFINLHKMSNRATPEMMSTYKLALLLHKIYNDSIPNVEWQHLNHNQYFTSRQTNFMINLSLHSVVGKNALCNRFHILNDQIKLDWLNLNINSYKIKCKKLFLTNN